MFRCSGRLSGCQGGGHLIVNVDCGEAGSCSLCAEGLELLLVVFLLDVEVVRLLWLYGQFSPLLQVPLV